MKKILISAISWEERFSLGLNKNIEENNIDNYLFIKYTGDNKHTDPINESTMKLIDDLKERKKIIKFSKNPVKNWFLLEKELKTIDGIITVDISTMKRETIFWLFYFMRINTRSFRYLYFSPEKYCSDKPLSREPLKPRFLLKHSGIFDIDKQTLVVILTGFDVERTKQIIHFYEPSKIMLGIQSNNKYSSRNKLKIHRKEILEDYNTNDILDFEYDSYSVDHGLASFISNIEPLLKDYNIIISSLGPKLSAVSLYKFIEKNPNIALSYVPMRFYEKDYSKGLEKKYNGEINFG